MRIISNQELLAVAGGDGDGDFYFGIDPFPNKCPRGYKGATLITYTETTTTTGFGGSVTLGGKTTVGAGFNGPLPQANIGIEANGSGTVTKNGTTTTRTETSTQVCLPVNEGLHGTPVEKNPGTSGGSVGSLPEEVTNLC